MATERKKVPFVQAAGYVVSMLVFGSLNTICTKVQFTIRSTGIDGTQELFRKPWFSTLNMFIAMCVALPVHFLMSRRRSSLEKPLMMPDDIARAPTPKMSVKMQRLFVAIPAAFDLLATGLCCMGLLYIPASVWQMLRGAEIIFTAILSVLILRRKLHAYHWVGVAICVLGICSVGYANIMGQKHSGSSGISGSDPEMLVVGMLLVLLGQVVQSSQIIAEEYLLQEVDMPEMLVVGFEGAWGVAIMGLVVFPLLYYLPGSDHGHAEDIWDCLALVKNSAPLLRMVLLYIFSCATYNISGMCVTSVLSAVHRVMLEASRTLIVWFFDLGVHYLVDPSSSFGEVWTVWSYLQALGFVLLLLGQATYDSMLKVPGLYYPLEEKPAAWSPSAMRYSSSPVPSPPDSRLKVKMQFDAGALDQL